MKNRLGYKRSDFYTKLIDISVPEDIILSGLDKDTAYDIRRGKKDGIHTNIHTDLNQFVEFYNGFAQTKGLNQINLAALHNGNNLLVTKAEIDSEVLVMHSYILDPSAKRVRLLHSASLYRNAEMGASKRSLVGRANRLLHFEDMILFKSQGYSIYDMGGYAFKTADQSLQRINLFKDGFGGRLVLESDYWPLTFLFVIRMRSMLSRLINRN
ncbi:MAG: hypothetical protein EOO88_35930 [Pedobacter sp.]|nr:MAG: hypothetical protein EOO88_35930 [Pedobacter sp.]